MNIRDVLQRSFQ